MKYSVFAAFLIFILFPNIGLACKMTAAGSDVYRKRAVTEYIKEKFPNKTIESIEVDSYKVKVYFKNQRTIIPQKYMVSFDGACRPQISRIISKKIKTH